MIALGWILLIYLGGVLVAILTAAFNDEDGVSIVAIGFLWPIIVIGFIFRIVFDLLEKKE